MRVLFYAALLALLVAVLFLGFATWRVFEKDKEVKGNYQTAEGKLESLEEQKLSLQADIASLGEERGIEEVVRERYPLARDGEEVIVIVDRKKAGEAEESTSSVGLWQRIKAFFGL